MEYLQCESYSIRVIAPIGNFPNIISVVIVLYPSVSLKKVSDEDLL